MANQWQRVESVVVEQQPLDAYNLTVADYSTFFVAGAVKADAVWVHNTCYTTANGKLPDGFTDTGRLTKSGQRILEAKDGRLIYQGRPPYENNWYAVDPTILGGVAKNSKWVTPTQGVEGPGLRDHYAKHGDDVGARSAGEYDLSARSTIQNGRRFTYRDQATGERRVGYFDEATGLFTATSETRGTPAILTHYPLTWAKIRRLPGFST